jgi:hypothetical protein
MDEDVSNIAEDLGIDPAAGVDDRQRYELLRKWHSEGAENETPDVERDLEGDAD